MREIKFRAWDSETKKFYPWGILEEGFRTPPQRAGWKFDHSQFTGLSDKNGVEIYEGDIIDANSTVGALREVIWLPVHASFGLRSRFGISTVYEHSELSECEVIGNIYENPELLESK